MGSCSSKGGGSGGGASNAKFNGFSITQDGKTEDYIVVNGEVLFADGRSRKDMFGIDQLEMIQRVYDIEGSSDKVIERINRIGKAKAEILPDKKVKKLQSERRETRKKKEEAFHKDVYKRKKGVKRHSAYWSAM